MIYFNVVLIYYFESNSFQELLIFLLVKRIMKRIQQTRPDNITQNNELLNFIQPEKKTLSASFLDLNESKFYSEENLSLPFF